MYYYVLIYYYKLPKQKVKHINTTTTYTGMTNNDENKQI